MSPLAEQLASQIRSEVDGKVSDRNRLFEQDDGFLTSKYIRPRVFKNRKSKNVDLKKESGFNHVTGRNKNGKLVVSAFRLRRSIRNKNKKPMHKLELGDFIMYDGEWQMAFSVTDKQAKIFQANGAVTMLNRKVNEIFLKQQLGEKGLENYLAQNNLTLEQLNAKTDIKNDSSMKPKIKEKLETGKKSSPRGGLAAEVASRKAAEASSGENGTNGKPEDKNAPPVTLGSNTAIDETTEEMKFHPLSELFPQIIGEDFAVLVQDIKDNGLHEKITTLDGSILDGRNRFKACIEASVKPRFEIFKGNDPVAFVISKNIHRRHLTESQRAAIAADISNTTHAGGSHSRNLPNGEKKITNADAAKAMKVSEASVRKAKAVKTKSPKLAQQIKSGEITLHAAAKEVGIVKEPENNGVANFEKTISPEEFEFRLAALEKMIPFDCDHKAFAVIATKFVQRQMAFGQA